MYMDNVIIDCERQGAAEENKYLYSDDQSQQIFGLLKWVESYFVYFTASHYLSHSLSVIRF